MQPMHFVRIIIFWMASAVIIPVARHVECSTTCLIVMLIVFFFSEAILIVLAAKQAIMLSSRSDDGWADSPGMLSADEQRGGS